MLDAKEKEQAATIEAKEKQRLADIEKAKTELAAFEKEIAPREAEADRQQKEKTAAAEKAVKDYEQSIVARLPELEKQLDHGTEWVALDPKELKASNGAKIEKEPDLSALVSGNNGKGTYQFIAESNLKGITAIKLDALADSRLPSNGPGRSPNGNFVLTEFELEAKPKDVAAKKVALQNAKADFSQDSYAVATAIDGQAPGSNNGWAIHPKTGVNHVASFELKEPLTADGPTALTFTLNQQFDDNQHTLGKFRISVTTSKLPISIGLPAEIAQILKVAPEQRDDKQKTALLAYLRDNDAEFKKLTLAAADAKKPRPTDPKLVELRKNLDVANQPVPLDAKLVQLREEAAMSTKQLANKRLTGAQDLAWALINSPAFLFNH